MGPFLILILVSVIERYGSTEQPRPVNNPCVDKGNVNPRLLPVDEAGAKPDFFQYRARLQMAVERVSV